VNQAFQRTIRKDASSHAVNRFIFRDRSISSIADLDQGTQRIAGAVSKKLKGLGSPEHPKNGAGRASYSSLRLDIQNIIY